MKKLTNVSPFLLLLFPIFMVMLFAFTININNSEEKEISAKTTATTANTIVKAATVILK
ncbi:hypothetical protein [Pedobacter sp. ASV28]|uniref:hypothetical protein n=1 Tax=Pedobacter sp. ASV28 TaxID=2795123 RepID=UPI0018ED372A|nr:hypothetical protein [Pedobacter sp. ASV28]